MRFLVLFFLTSFFALPHAQAAVKNMGGDSTTRKLMQWGADESTLDRKTHIVKLKGNAYVYRENEVVRGDYIELDTVNDLVHAEGRVQYQYIDYYIRADSIDLNLRAKTGTVINGNLSNGQFALRGSKIEQVEPNHFIVSNYDYSTCQDCPNAWEMTGTHGDFTIDGYAVMKDFIFKIKDVPFGYLPLMVIPIKTKRQSGFLFPRFGSGQIYGNYFVEPYYWAINDWSDATVGVGDYSKRGVRFEAEYRYALTDRSQGTMNVFWTRDSEVKNLYFRYAGRTAITQEFPYGIEGKLRINEVSDSGYPITYSDDVPGRQEPVLTSDLFFSRNDPELSTTVSFRRIRNLLQFDSTPDHNFVSGFDARTVQEFPRVVVNSNDRFVFGQKLAFGIEGRFNRFTRAAGPLDVFTAPTSTGFTQVETIREATRFTLIPNIYTTLNPWPWLSLVPSVQYRSFLYNFDGVYPNLARGYLLAQAEMSLQVEKFYPTNDPKVSYKHTIRPTLTYSVIPTTQQPMSHPFIDQVQSKAYSGQYFDNSDIVPIEPTLNLDSYFTPLANSLTYGVVTQIFKKENQGTPDTKVSRRFEAGVSQTLDIREAKKALDNENLDDRIVLSPVFTHFIYQNESFYAGLDYTYFSYLERYQAKNGNFANLLPFPNAHRVSTTASWTFEHAIKDGILTYDRSVYANYSFSKLTSKVSALSFGGNFSINDYIMPKAAFSYNLVQGAPSHLLMAAGSILFQSPSRCWQIELGMIYTSDRGHSDTYSLALNMTGNSFGSLDDSLKK